MIGKDLNVFLRPSTLDDAKFIFETRRNPNLNSFLGGEPTSLAGQMEWQKNYLLRHAAGEEFYFIICKCQSGEACGLLRVYDIKDSACTWGSWVLVKSRPAGSAIQSAFLSFKFIFNELNLNSAKLKVHKANIRALRLYTLFGFQIDLELEEEYAMSLSSCRFASQVEHWSCLLARTEQS